MRVEIIRIERHEGGTGIKDSYVVVARAFEGWRKMGYDKWNVIQSNWTVWHGLGMWRWYRENPDEMHLRLYAKDELDAFQKVANWEDPTAISPE